MIHDRLTAAVESMDQTTAKRALAILLEISPYLDDHNPEGDEFVGKFACSGRPYHVPPCGNFTTEGACEAGEPLPWCHVSGFDCPDCAAVAALADLLEEAPTTTSGAS